MTELDWMAMLWRYWVHKWGARPPAPRTGHPCVVRVTPGGRVIYDPVSVWNSDKAVEHREALKRAEARLGPMPWTVHD